MSQTKRCPKGYIFRSPYKRRFTSTIRKQGYVAKRGEQVTRIYPKSSTITVKGSCIKNRGLPGKGAPGSFAILRKGELSKYGYAVKRTEAERHSALKKAVDAYSAIGVYRKLDAVTKLTLRTAPEAHKIFKADRDWIYKKFVAK